MAKSECTSCQKVFKSPSAFDMHRTGSYGEPIYKNGDPKTRKTIGYAPPTRRCMTTEEMREAGMSQNAQGLWIGSTYDPKAHGDDDEDEQVLEESLPENEGQDEQALPLKRQ